MPITHADAATYSDERLNCFLNRILETVDQSVFPYLDLQLHHNAQYAESELLHLLTHCSLENEFANTGAKTRAVQTDTDVSLRSDDRSSVAKALGYHLRELDRDDVSHQFDTVFEQIRDLAQRARLFTSPVDLAIDVHDWLFYGEEATEMVANANPSQGTDTAYKFLTACAVAPEARVTVGIVPLADKTVIPAAIDEVVAQAREWVDIRRVYLDREFYRVSILKRLEDNDLNYVVRAPRYQALADGEPCVRVDRDYKVTQSYSPYDWVRVHRFAVPHAESPAEKQTYFVTNLDVDTESAQSLADSYRRRWGIETSYRVIGDFLAKSRSKSFSVRLFYFLFAVTLYNLWVVTNLLLTVVFDGEIDSPVVSGAVFGQIVLNRWLSEMSGIG
ncbi:MAG: transposase [Halodesulfurarchaeum sp.]